MGTKSCDVFEHADLVSDCARKVMGRGSDKESHVRLRARRVGSLVNMISRRDQRRGVLSATLRHRLHIIVNMSGVFLGRICRGASPSGRQSRKMLLRISNGARAYHGEGIVSLTEFNTSRKVFCISKSAISIRSIQQLTGGRRLTDKRFRDDADGRDS